VQPLVRILSDGSFINAGAKMAVDGGGIISFIQDPAETSKLQLDWTGYLDGETISASAWTAQNLTGASAATSGNITSIMVSAVPLYTHGHVENTITTSGGRISRRRVRFYGQHH